MVNMLETQPYFMNDQDHPQTGGVTQQLSHWSAFIDTERFRDYQIYR